MRIPPVSQTLIAYASYIHSPRTLLPFLQHQKNTKFVKSLLHKHTLQTLSCCVSFSLVANRYLVLANMLRESEINLLDAKEAQA